MLSKKYILNTIRDLKSVYSAEGLDIIGLFGSFAKGSATKYSDIDIAYEIDYHQFSKKYKDGFSKLLRIEEIKEELQKKFQTKIDLVPQSGIDKDEIIYV